MSDLPSSRDRNKTELSWLRVGVDEVIVEISAKPGSSRRGVVRAGPQGLVIALNSAPEKGKANDELIEYLADELRVPRAALMMISGATSRLKTIRIITHEAAKVAARLRRISSDE
jgi:uncharacterized protein (TIGR00251 family)